MQVSKFGFFSRGHGRCARMAAGLSLAAALLFAAPAPSLELREVFVGSVDTLRVGAVSRVAVGNENALGASVLDDGKVLLIGQAPGVSELTVWTQNGRQIEYRVRVYDGPQSDRLGVIRAVIEPFPNVSMERKVDKVVLTGTVDSRDFERFGELVDSLENVVSLVEPQLNVEIEKSVVFDVKMLEVNRNFQRTLGVRWNDTAAGPAIGVVGNAIPNDAFGIVSDVGDTGRLEELLAAVGPESSTLSGYLGFTTAIGSELQLLEEEGIARVLAEPRLSTVSGEEATFLAGGDFPTAVLNEFGQPVVEFREFGIQLDIEPLVDRHNNVRSNIRVEMSSIDTSIQVNGVPGLRRRETVSTITARPGETIIISGLTNSQDARNVDKVPFLGDIPLLGALFRSRDFQRMRTELVVTVTPRILEPNEPIPEGLARAEKALRGVLKGSESLDDALVY